LSSFGADALGAVDRGAVEQKSVRPVDGVDDLVHAEEAAPGLDLAQPGLPQTCQHESKHG